MATTSYYLYDGIGSTVGLTDSNHAVLDAYTYEAFGTQRSFTSAKNAYRYVGQLGYYYDEETQDYYIRARHYDSRVARFCSQDPRTSSDNLYVYASNAPLLLVDPSGRAPILGPTEMLDLVPSEPSFITPDPFMSMMPVPACCGVEIGPALMALQFQFAAAFHRLSLAEKGDMCQSMLHENGWDIRDLFLWAGGKGRREAGDLDPRNDPARSFPGRLYSPPCGVSPCIGTVTVFGNCYWANEVNYFLFGLARRHCAEESYRQSYIYSGRIDVQGDDADLAIDVTKSVHLQNALIMTKRLVHAWKTYKYGDRNIWDPSAIYRRPGSQSTESQSWTEAGFTGNFAFALGTNINDRCDPCKELFTGSLAVHVGTIMGKRVDLDVTPLSVMAMIAAQ